jgi:hypothetical protein
MIMTASAFSSLLAKPAPKPYKALLVDGSGNGYLQTVCDYVHLNPVRAKLLEAQAKLDAFTWSSYSQYLKTAKERPAWLRVDRLLGEKGIPKDTPAGRREFALRMEQRRLQENLLDYRPLRRAWCLGSEEFRDELLASMHERLGPNHYGMERRETSQQKSRADRPRGVERTPLDRSGHGRTPQRRQGQSQTRPPSPDRNHHDLGLDRPASAHGELDLRLKSVS